MTGDNLTLTASGTPDQNGDIRIQGGQLQAGKDLHLNASRDIQLSSSQNTKQTTGKNSSRGSSLGVDLTAGPGGTGINLSVSTNRSKGGYQVKVGEHTQLDGSVIASTADKDTLDTGTLSFGDIQNKADFKTEHHSVNISTAVSANHCPLTPAISETDGQSAHGLPLHFPLPGLTGIIGCPQELDSHNESNIQNR